MTNYEWITLLISIIGSTWYLSCQIHACVKHDICEKRRDRCQCVKDIREIKKQIKNERDDEDEENED